jgi:hypothetical protein
MKKSPPRKTWIYVLVGVLVGVFILSGSIFVIVKAVREMGPGAEARLSELCIERLGQVAKAQLLYSADHDDMLPPAEVWLDATWTYGEKVGPKGEKIHPKETNESNFRCPSISALRAGGYGYAFHSELSLMRISEPAKPGEEALVFDSRLLSRNANGKLSEMLAIPHRHNGATKNNVAYLSGSVKSISEAP